LPHNPVRYTAQQERWITDKISNWTRFWNRCGYSRVPDLSGKRVLDLGSGLGGNSVAAAKAGADVVAIEPDSRILEISAQLIGLKYPEVIDKIEFVNTDTVRYRSEYEFSYVICDEVFEHINDLAAALEQMALFISEDGKIVSSWGPLWESPFGGHQLTIYLILKRSRFGMPRIGTKSRAGDHKRFRIPYGHVIWTRLALNELSIDGRTSAPETIQEVGLNGLKRSEFLRTIEASSLHTDFLVENAGTHLFYRIARTLHRFPPIRRLITSNMCAVLSRVPADSNRNNPVSSRYGG
jgi:SAM-dependent methyltransferase